MDLVTGGAGFIGSHLVDALIARRRKVRVVDSFASGHRRNLAQHASNAALEIVEADVADAAAMLAAARGVERVFHLAALADIVPSIQKPEAYFRANVDGTFAVLQAARAASIKRFVYVASSSCYGIPDDYPTSEEAEIRPQYPYALTKWLGECLVMHWAQVYRLPALSLRFFNIYGPRARTSGTYGAVFGVFLAQLLAGKPLTIVGDGTQQRDYLYVGDLVRGIEAALKRQLTGVYQLGCGQPTTLHTLVATLEKVSGRDFRVRYEARRSGEVHSTWCNIAKAAREFDYNAPTDLEAGLRTTWSWYLENRDIWVRQQALSASD